jgi:hypothetical protein
MKKKNKEEELTWPKRSSPAARPSYPAQPTKPGHLLFREGVIVFLPEMEAARWNSLSHPIHRRLLDTGDEGHRPRSAIKRLSAAESEP